MDKKKTMIMKSSVQHLVFSFLITASVAHAQMETTNSVASNFKDDNSVEKKEMFFFKFNIRPGITYSDFSLQYYDGLNTSTAYFDSHLDFRFGIEAECVFPNARWTIIGEPTYTSYSNELLFGGSNNYEIAYTCIEMPLGARYYLPIGKRSKLFGNASFAVDIPLHIAINWIPDIESSKIYLYEIFGIGYTYNDKWSVELRRSTNKDLLTRYVLASNKYFVNSFVLSYNFYNGKRKK